MCRLRKASPRFSQMQAWCTTGTLCLQCLWMARPGRRSTRSFNGTSAWSSSQMWRPKKPPRASPTSGTTQPKTSVRSCRRLKFLISANSFRNVLQEVLMCASGQCRRWWRNAWRHMPEAQWISSNGWHKQVVDRAELLPHRSQPRRRMRRQFGWAVEHVGGMLYSLREPLVQLYSCWLLQGTSNLSLVTFSVSLHKTCISILAFKPVGKE